MLQRLDLRQRIFLFFALIAVTVLLSVGLAIWAGLQSAPEWRVERLAVYTALAALVSAVLSLLIWLQFDRFIARALLSLARSMESSLHGGSLETLNDEDLRYLGPLQPAATEVLSTIQRIQAEQAREHAREEARLRTHERRLTAILRDLDRPLIMANREHRISLFNDEASARLETIGDLGVGRRLGEFFELTTLKHALAELEVQCHDNSIPRPRVCKQIACVAAHGASDAAAEPSHMDVSLSPIQDDQGGLTGYVLMLDADTVPCALPARPDFHDFTLFDRPVDQSLNERPLHAINYVVFDTETTGLEPSRGDEIVSIAAVRVVNGRVLEHDTFNELVNPGRPIPPASTRFHGIVDADVADCDPIEAVLPRFRRFVADSVLVAHNAAFDMKFLAIKQQAAGVDFDNNLVLDTVLLSAWLHDHTGKHSLDDLAARFDVDIQGRHTALGDSQVTAEIFVRMLPLLEARGIYTLVNAMDISSRATDIKRQQARY